MFYSIDEPHNEFRKNIVKLLKEKVFVLEAKRSNISDLLENANDFKIRNIV